MQAQQLKRIGDLILENKKKFYRNMWRNYHRQDLLKRFFNEWDDRFPEFLWDHQENKAYARELKIIYLAAEAIFKKVAKHSNGWYHYAEDRERIMDCCEMLHHKYWKRFHKVYGNRARLAGGWPHMNKTQALMEFLSMGFIYKTDIKYEPKDYYCVYAHIGGLWWPEPFESHGAAIEIQNKFGIWGLTGTTLQKSK